MQLITQVRLVIKSDVCMCLFRIYNGMVNINYAVTHDVIYQARGECIELDFNTV